VLGGKIDAMMRASEAPPDMPAAPGREKMIMHARMSLPDGSVLMASDAPGEQFHKPQGFSISLTIADVAEAERKFNALADGGNVTMPFSKTFWAKGFGMCVDRFGIPWMVNCPAEGM
jgi:PhnB protein